MADVFKDPRYRGKHVVLTRGQVYTARTGNKALELLEKLEKKYPGATPEVAYLPKARFLVLWL